jgi:hypothetical protein
MLKIRTLPQIRVSAPNGGSGLETPVQLSCLWHDRSGKTVAVLNLLTNPQMYGGYFDEVYVFSAMGKPDDSLDALTLPKRHVFTDEMIPELHKIIERQKKAVDRKGVDKAKKVCLIFEDLTANRQLVNSPDFIKASCKTGTSVARQSHVVTSSTPLFEPLA